MLRMILAVFTGLLVGLVMTATVESVGHMLFPPEGLNLTDPAALRTAMDRIPREAKVFIVLGWFIGLLSAVASSCLVAGRRALAGRITATLLAVFLAWTLVTLPYPAWMRVTAILAAAAGALLAERAFGRPRTQKA